MALVTDSRSRFPNDQKSACALSPLRPNASLEHPIPPLSAAPLTRFSPQSSLRGAGCIYTYPHTQAFVWNLTRGEGERARAREWVPREAFELRVLVCVRTGTLHNSSGDALHDEVSALPATTISQRGVEAEGSCFLATIVRKTTKPPSLSYWRRCLAHGAVNVGFNFHSGRGWYLTSRGEYVLHPSHHDLSLTCTPTYKH